MPKKRMVEPELWMRFSACRGKDPDIFFPGVGDDGREARATCAACVARPACLDYAMRFGVRDGIWGGMSARERTRHRRSLKLTVVA